MSKLGVVEDTLFVPMLGRIYASEYCPQKMCIRDSSCCAREIALEGAIATANGK